MEPAVIAACALAAIGGVIVLGLIVYAVVRLWIKHRRGHTDTGASDNQPGPLATEGDQSQRTWRSLWRFYK